MVSALDSGVSVKVQALAGDIVLCSHWTSLHPGVINGYQRI